MVIALDEIALDDTALDETALEIMLDDTLLSNMLIPFFYKAFSYLKTSQLVGIIPVIQILFTNTVLYKKLFIDS